MKVLMVTPHLPPHQAANALLPHLLGEGLAARGHQVRFLTFGSERDTDRIAFVRRRRGLRVTRVPQALEALDTWRKCGSLVRQADLVHVHSNTWMNQVAASVAVRERTPYVLTHYGTEIWHHDGSDARFRRLNARAAFVAFYSEALLRRGRELNVPLPRGSGVIYPPVAEAFGPLAEPARKAARASVAPDAGLLLVNVKRLHPLADHATLLEAMAVVARERKDARLLIAGAGECEAPLKLLSARLGLSGVVRFLGLMPNHSVAQLTAAADLFVLSSTLEATPTVVLEALACGTPVLSTDNPGGVELSGFFGDDVAVVPQRDPESLARGILAAAAAPRRTRPGTAETIAARFRLGGVLDQYLAAYRLATA